MWLINHLKLKIILISVSAFDRAFDSVKSKAMLL